MKSVKTLALVAAMCAAMMALTACGNNADKPAAPAKDAPKPATTVEQKQVEPKQDMTLAKWHGEWDDISVYINDPKFDAAFKEKAQREGKDAEEIKKALAEKRKSDFRGIVFDGNKISFLDNFKSKGGKVIAESEYEFVNSHEVKHGSHTLQLSEWKAKDPQAKYPVVILLPPHGEEELTHFHMRYGTDAQELLKKENWFPTFIKPSSTDEQLMEEFKE